MNDFVFITVRFDDCENDMMFTRMKIWRNLKNVEAFFAIFPMMSFDISGVNYENF